MILSNIFEPFIAKRPVCVMARGILERLFDPTHLDSLFARTAQLGYTRQLHFSTLVTLMGHVVMGTQASVHAAYQAFEKSEELVSLTAIYKKLDRVELAVSSAIVRESARQAAPVIDQLSARQAPWLPGYRCRILDGNHLAPTEHRIEPLRTVWDAPLPGKSLVVLDQERMLAEEVFLTEDGHAQERSLLGSVLACIQENDLWIADRNFCTLGFLFGIVNRLGYFVIRQHGCLIGELQGVRKKKGRCDTGMMYEQIIVLTDPDTKQTKRFRRITVELDQPPRNGDKEIHILTNLKRKEASSRKVAELYRKRWTIETAFQEITVTLNCEIKTLGYPKAALFGFCLALMIYNGISILKAGLRAVHGEETVQGKISGYFLSLEITGTYEGMMIAIPEEHWSIFRTMSVSELAEVIRELAGRLQLERYQKHPRGPKKKFPPKERTTKGGNVSTIKLLNANK